MRSALCTWEGSLRCRVGSPLRAEATFNSIMAITTLMPGGVAAYRNGCGPADLFDTHGIFHDVRDVFAPGSLDMEIMRAIDASPCLVHSNYRLNLLTSDNRWAVTRSPANQRGQGGGCVGFAGKEGPMGLRGQAGIARLTPGCRERHLRARLRWGRGCFF